MRCPTHLTTQSCSWTSLSLLTLQYLEAEANERGLNHEDLG